MEIKTCKSCNRQLGYIVTGDVLCNCGTYNIIRPNKQTKLIYKDLYKPSTDLKYCAQTTYTMVESLAST